jgi:hypothetical protein
MHGMGRQMVVGVVAVVAWLPACGGRVMSDGSSVDSGTSASPVSPVSGDAAANAGGGSAGPGGTEVLPACHPGFFPSDRPDLPCSYMYDNRCYQTKSEACGCACPNHSGTTCSSGFPQLDGRVAVTCG